MGEAIRPFSNAALKAVVYDFSPRRAGEHARNLLGTWNGKPVCGDFAGCTKNIRKSSFSIVAIFWVTLSNAPGAKQPCVRGGFRSMAQAPSLVHDRYLLEGLKNVHRQSNHFDAIY